MKWHLVTFAGGSRTWRMTASRLARQAKRSNLFSKITICDADTIQSLSPSNYRATQDPGQRRGFGFWRWKPLIIRDALMRCSPEEGIIYLDAGCELNLNPKSLDRMRFYFETVRDSGLLGMQLDDPLRQWCKRETLDFFGLSAGTAGSVPVIEAGVILATAHEKSTAVIEEWAVHAEVMDGFLFDDAYDVAVQSPDFREHRHDQAVLSCIMHNNQLSGLPNETYFGPEWLPGGQDYPIWTMRNRFPFSRRPGTLGEFSITLAKTLRDRLRTVGDG